MNINEIIKMGIPDRIVIHKLKKRGFRSVLFTFDDGPNPEFTPAILEILKEYQVQAIFFIQGSLARSYPGLVRRIRKEGHILGNHSYNHDHKKRLSFQDYRADVLKCQDTVAGIVGEKPSLFRPPGGRVSMTSLAVSMLSRLTTMLWTAEGYEWTRCKKNDPDSIGHQLIARLKGGEIVLLHDDNPKVPIILNLVLPYLKNGDYDLINGIQYT